jgi:hypothetical protein
LREQGPEEGDEQGLARVKGRRPERRTLAGGELPPTRRLAASPGGVARWAKGRAVELGRSGDVHIFELGKECLGNPNGGGRRTRTDAALRDGRLTGLMAGASRRVPWRRACGSAELGKEEAG